MLRVKVVGDQVLDRVCSNLLLGYSGVQVTQPSDISARGFGFVHREDGCHSDRGRGLSAHFVDRLHVALSRALLVSP
ncbi:hypothetical protein TIFTF001_037451 [Ficus carica]|uniref:Uncharacterized protein n=1 Tax=Ficus carica TaxID=3494 RepID=A0AA88E9S1_FICCA|nr:hypothetical protein TIFTF001_037451 [Ficus carica]